MLITDTVATTTLMPQTLTTRTAVITRAIKATMMTIMTTNIMIKVLLASKIIRVKAEEGVTTQKKILRPSVTSR